MNLFDAGDLLGNAAATVDPLQGRAGRGTLGIRPEHLVIGTAEGAVGIGEARVNRIEDLGHEALVHLSNARGSALTVRASGDIRGTVSTGETLSLALRPDRLHAFDSATGERLE
ncbi:MAG: TOBE domain-containing protein [Rhodospirillales bacterium]|nr:TOBE domain-containing protein [Rhodospirillales bacterium]